MRLASVFGAALLALGLSVSAAHAQEAQIPITFRCHMLAPGRGNAVASTPVECLGGGLPYTVPADKRLCLTHLYLMTKYPYNPPRYGDNMYSMYMIMSGISVAAHHPEVTFYPSFEFRTNPLRVYISNGMDEEIWVYGIVQGFLVPDSQQCS